MSWGAAQAPEWAKGSAGREARAQACSWLRAGSGLNASQVAAVETALGRTLVLWQACLGFLHQYDTCLHLHAHSG